MPAKGPRRPHQKSRKGCAECKRRHVKCNEERPICSTCKRLELPCGFETPIRGPPISQRPTDRVIDSSSSAGWSTADLELIHHYTTCGCVCAPGEHRRKLWTNDIVTLSFSHRYLLHQILAVSALHLHSQNPADCAYAARATVHRAQALGLIQPVIANMTADQSIPVFAFAGLTMINAFAELTIRLADEGADHNLIRHISECFQLNRGINMVVKSYYNHIANSWAGELVSISGAEDFLQLEASDQKMDREASLHQLIDTEALQPVTNEALHEALDILLKSIQILMWRDQDHSSIHLINAWPSELKPEFWQSLGDNESPALVIMAYFAVAMKLRPMLWWFRQWPELLFNEVEELLGHRYEAVLAWPKMTLLRLDKTNQIQ